MKNNEDTDYQHYITGIKKPDGINPVQNSTNTGICDDSLDQTITMLGRVFTIAELNVISRFAAQLEASTNILIDHTDILDGSVFMVKIVSDCNFIHDIDIKIFLFCQLFSVIFFQKVITVLRKG